MKYFLTLFVALLLNASFAQHADPNYQGLILAQVDAKGSLLLSDGKYIVYGDFTRVNGQSRPYLVRFNADGTVDPTFNIGAGPDGPVHEVKLQPDGKLLVAGTFETFNGQPHRALVRLLADGTTDTSFKFNFTFGVHSSASNSELYILADGRILFAADFGSTLIDLIRLSTNGSHDPSFAEVIMNGITDIDVQSTGKIILGGGFTKGIARLNADGTPDASFNIGTGFNNNVSALEVTSADAILVVGMFTEYNAAANNYLAGLTADGALDATFQGNGKPNANVKDITEQADGKILIAGAFSTFNGTSSNRLARLTTTGALDATFAIGTGVTGGLTSVSTNAAGEVVITGVLSAFNGTPRTGLAVLTSAGALKAISENLKLRKAGIARKLLLQGDKLLVGHQSDDVNGTNMSSLVRLNADGSTDGTFIGNGATNGLINTMALDATGNILIGGFFSNYAGTACNHFVRVSANGTLDNTFKTNLGTGFSSTVTAVAVLPDNKIIVGGSFSTVNGVSRKYLVRLNSNGTVDNGFNAGNIFAANASADIRIIKLLSDGKLLIGGRFSTVDGNNISALVRLNADGTYDNTFLVGTGAIYAGNEINSSVNDLITLANGKHLIGGFFTKVNEVPKSGIALLNADGTLDNTFVSSPAIAIVDAFHQQPDGKIVVVGTYSISRLNPEGSIDATFNTISTFAGGNDVTQVGNDIIVAGQLSRVNSTPAFGIARIVYPTADSPTSLHATEISASSISLAWNDNSNSETGYEIYRSISPGLFQMVQALPANTTSFTNTSLLPDAIYNYMVRAMVAGNNSTYSNKISQRTTPSEWTTISNTLPTRSDGVTATANGKAYMGLGRNGAGALNDWWEFNPEDNTWTQKANFPGPARIGAVAFVANGKIYAGTGNDFSGTGFRRDFYEYDPATNIWTPKADFPEDFTSGAGITSGVAFSINNIGYVGLGNTGSNNTTAFYKYDPTANNWLAIAAFAGPGRTSAIAFSTNERGYVGFGSGGLGPNRNDLWEYNPTANSWTQKASSSGTGRSGGAVTVLNGNAYLIGGIENTTGFGGTEVYTSTNFAYDIAANIWSAAGAIPSVGRTDAMSFTVDEKVYVFGGYRYAAGNIYLADQYSFVPATSFFPATPTNLVATYYSTDHILLNWTDNATDETSYFVEYAVGTTDNFIPLATLSANASQYSHTGLIANTQYHYRVRSINAYWTSDYSNIASRANIPPPSFPVSPYIEALTTTSARFTWVDNSATEDGFEIYRSLNNEANYVLIHTTAADATSYTDNTFNAGIHCYYKVRAINAGGNSYFTMGITAPRAPTALQVTSFTDTSVTLAWTDNATTETGFDIYRSTNDNTNFALTASTGQNSINASHSANQKTTYVFKLQAKNQTGKSLFSNEVTVTTKETVPSAPTLLPITIKTTTSMVIDWTDNSSNETSFELERAVYGGAGYVLIETLSANATTFTNIELTPNTTYFYRMRAKNSGGYSAYSNEISNFTLSPPPILTKPSNLVANISNGNRIVLNWTDNSNNELIFEIHRSAGNADNFVLLNSTPANATTFTDIPEGGVEYFYKVRASNNETKSDFTNVVSKMIPLNVTGLETPDTWDGISAYPNPTVDRFTISNATQNEISISVYSSTGKLMFTDKIERATDKTIDSSRWPVSLYFLQVSGKAGAVKIFKK